MLSSNVAWSMSNRRIWLGAEIALCTTLKTAQKARLDSGHWTCTLAISSSALTSPSMCTAVQLSRQKWNWSTHINFASKRIVTALGAKHVEFTPKRSFLGRATHYETGYSCLQSFIQWNTSAILHFDKNVFFTLNHLDGQIQYMYLLYFKLPQEACSKIDCMQTL